MRVAVIDPGSGNLASVRRALERVGREAEIGLEIDVTTDAETLRAADRIVLPGQGAFAACRRGLDALPGMVEALEARVRGQGVPFLGICVGMQLLAERGLEHGVSFGLGWIHGQVERMDPRGADGAALPLPQMGWNALAFSPELDHPLLDGIAAGDHAYFVHSYAFRTLDPEDVLATTDYGGPVAAIVGRANTVGTQFHVEKSQAVGLRLLANFLRWEP
jgi:glutamine amidotransferase